MCSSTTAERQSLASRDRTCCLRRCLPARPLRFYGFRGSIAHPTQSLCTLRTRRRRRPRNTRYRAPATAYPDRSLTGRSTPASLAHKQSILSLYGDLDCFAEPVIGRAFARPGGCVPSMIDSLEVKVFYPAWSWRRISETQGRRREVGSERSVEQNRGPMDKKRIRGLPGRTSEQPIAKSTAIKGRGGRSDGRAAKAVDLTSGDLCCVPQSGLGPPQGGLTAVQKSAEGVVGGATR